MDRQALAAAIGGRTGTSIAPRGMAQRDLSSSFTDRMMAGATFGLPAGYTTRDNGRGTQEILDAAGNVVGKGFDDTTTTLTEWQRENVLGSIQEGENTFSSPYLTDRVQATRLDNDGAMVPIYGGGEGSEAIYEDKARQFQSREEAQAELQKLLDSSSSVDQVYGNKEMSDYWPLLYATPNRWEAIGIMANNPGGVYQGALGEGTYDPGASNHRAEAGNFVGLPNTVRGNAVYDPTEDNVSGQNAMYGSTPVFKNGQLIGYKVDTRLMSPEDQAKIKAHDASPRNSTEHQVGDMGLATAWNRRSSATQNTMARELNAGWDQFSKISDTEYFVPTDKIGEVPGWKNKSMASYENWAGGSFLDKVMSNPMAIAGIALAFTGIPGMIGNVLTGAAASAAPTLGASIIGGAVTGGAMSALGGGDFLTGAATGALSGGMSGWSPTSSVVGNAAIKGAISGGAGAMLNKGDIGAGLVSGGLAGSVGGYIGDATGSNFLGTVARQGTGLLAGNLMADSPDSQEQSAAPTAPTQPKTSSGWVIPETTGNSDAKALTARQQVAASLRSY